MSSNEVKVPKKRRLRFLLFWTLLPALFLFASEELGIYDAIGEADFVFLFFFLGLMILTALFQWTAISSGIVSRFYMDILKISQWIVGIWPLGFVFAYLSARLAIINSVGGQAFEDHLSIKDLWWVLGIYVCSALVGSLWTAIAGLAFAEFKKKELPRSSNILDQD